MKWTRSAVWCVWALLAMSPVVAVQAQAPQAQNEVQLEGDVEVFVEDYPAGSTVRYFLNAAGRRREMRFTANPPGLQTGERIRVRGNLQPDGALQLASGSSVESLAALTSMQQGALGAQATVVILVTFAGGAAAPYTTTHTANVMGQTSQHFNWGSYGQTTVAADVVGWLPISYDPTTEPTVCNYGTIASLADTAATNAGVALGNYKRKVYGFPGIGNCGWWGLGSVGGNPSRAWVNGSFALHVVGHELGHNLGLYHANALDCGTVTLGPACTTLSYGNTLDIMGNKVAGDFSLFMKERLGWVNAGASPPYEVVTTDGTYFIAPYEAQATASKGLKLLKSTDPVTLKKTHYYVEFRQALSADSFLSTNANVLNGVVVTTGSESSVDSSLLLDMTPATTSWYDPALTDGLAFTDPGSGLTIQTLSTDASGASVMVTFGPTPCVPGMPAVSVEPSPIWVPSGSPASYTATVTNRDSSNCAASTFDLAASVPSGWTGSPGSASLLLGPGQSGSISFAVTALAGTGNGYYPVALHATNRASTVFAGQVSFLQPISNGTLNITAASSKASYRANETVTLTASVKLGTASVAGAAVAFTVLKSGSVTPTTYHATTNASGVATVALRFKVKPSPAGTYSVTAAASVANSAGSGPTSFVIR